MEEKRVYLKLKELDGQQITIEEAYGFKFQKWDDATNTFIKHDTYQEFMRGDRGWRKMYSLKTTTGYLEVSEYQLQNMLVAVYKNGIANIIGATFTIKKVIGKNNIPNYYFNVVRDSAPKPVANTPDPAEEISLSDIPF